MPPQSEACAAGTSTFRAHCTCFSCYSPWALPGPASDFLCVPADFRTAMACSRPGPHTKDWRSRDHSGWNALSEVRTQPFFLSLCSAVSELRKV